MPESSLAESPAPDADGDSGTEGEVDESPAASTPVASSSRRRRPAAATTPATTPSTRVRRPATRPSTRIRSRLSGRGTSGPTKRRDDRVETVMRLIPIDSRDASVDTSDAIGTGEGRWAETKIIKGKMYVVEDDELVIPDDVKGDVKVDKNGVLQSGRSYKVPTFTSKMRKNPSKHFMLSIDAARAAGFRDSLYFFRKNPLIQKLSCNQVEKEALIANGFLSVNLKHRSVTLCSALNVYKNLGARIVKDGKFVIDDYYEDQSILDGHVAGEPAYVDHADAPRSNRTELEGLAGPDPSNTPASSQQYAGSAFRRALWSFHPPVPSISSRTIFGGDGKPPYGEKGWDPSEKKRKPAVNLTPQNWMCEYARATSEMNRFLRNSRRTRLKLIKLDYEPEIVGEEWRDVEVDVPIGDNGEIIRTDESDTEVESEEVEDEVEEDAVGDGISSKGEEVGEASRDVSTQPVDAPIQIHGEPASRFLEVPTTTTTITKDDLASSVQASSDAEHSSRQQTSTTKPHQALPSSTVKTCKKKLEARWTTTIKERQLCQRSLPTGLWDVYGNSAHVSQHTQSTIATIQKISSTPSSRRQREEEEDGDDKMELDHDDRQTRKFKQQRLDRVYKSGFTTVDIVVRDLPNVPLPPLLPGMWEFGPHVQPAIS